MQRKPYPIEDRTLKNVYAKGNLVKKFITPDFYTDSQTATTNLALPTAPDVAVITFETAILKTKSPAGPGVYGPARPNNNESGGGKEATIFNPSPLLDSYFEALISQKR